MNYRKQAENPVCRKCGVALNDENWYPSLRGKKKSYICKECLLNQNRKWRNANQDKVRAQGIRAIRRKGVLPMSKNNRCSSYLGVYVAERVLSYVFKNVERMSYEHSGYDFICGRGYRIDVKASCIVHKQRRWFFNIKKNKIADYFLCLAFDNREDLNPKHIWLLPAGKFNHLASTSIKASSIHKWDKYALHIDKVITCCNIMKS